MIAPLLAASLFRAPRAGAADEPPAPQAPPRSYALQIAFAHAIPTAVMWSLAGLGELTKEDAFGVPGGVAGFGTLFAPPIVHWGHGRVGTGFGSLAGNTGATLLGLIIGFAIGSRQCPRSEDSGAGFELCTANLYGALLGMTVGQAFWTPLDMSLAEPPDTPAPPRAATSLRLAPVARATPGGTFTFGVVGWL